MLFTAVVCLAYLIMFNYVCFKGLCIAYDLVMIIAGKFYSLTGVWSRFCLHRNLKEKASGLD